MKKLKNYSNPIKVIRGIRSHMSNLEGSYQLILSELRKISNQDNFYFKPISPVLSDLDLISLVILAELKSIDSEYQLLQILKGLRLNLKLSVVFIIEEKVNSLLTLKRSE